MVVSEVFYGFGQGTTILEQLHHVLSVYAVNVKSECATLCLHDTQCVAFEVKVVNEALVSCTLLTMLVVSLHWTQSTDTSISYFYKSEYPYY